MRPRRTSTILAVPIGLLLAGCSDDGSGPSATDDPFPSGAYAVSLTTVENTCGEGFDATARDLLLGEDGAVRIRREGGAYFLSDDAGAGDDAFMEAILDGNVLRAAGADDGADVTFEIDWVFEEDHRTFAGETCVDFVTAPEVICRVMFDTRGTRL